MEVKMKTLVESIPVMNILSETYGLPSVTAYRILKNKNRIKSEFELFDNERKKLIFQNVKRNELGKPLEIDGNYMIEEDKIEYVTSQMEQLLNMNVEIDLFLFSLEDINDVGLSPSQIELIEFMLEIK